MRTSFLFYETIIQRTTALYIKITLQVCYKKFIHTKSINKIGIVWAHVVEAGVK
jgi:hypothetical protein